MIVDTSNLPGGDDLYSRRWRRTLLFALPFAIAAFLIGWVLEKPSAQEMPIDLIGYPVMAAVLLFLEFLLACNKRMLRPVLLSIIAGAKLFFIAKCFTLFFLAPDTVDVQAQLTETFYWVPVVFLLSFILPGIRAGRRIIIAFTSLTFIMSFVYSFSEPLNAAQWGVLYTLIQMNLANTVLLALTTAFMTFKEDYVRARTRMETAERFAYVDSLTKLPNRHVLEQELNRRIQKARDTNTLLAVLFIDIDGFKLVNDTLGHETGDELLKRVAERFSTVIGENDLLSRLSGDEFVVVTELALSGSGAKYMAQKLQAALCEPFDIAGQNLNVTSSIGISLFPEDGKDGPELLRHADSAMYRVKHSGKNGIEKFHGLADERIERERNIERLLRNAIHDNAFHLLYQPLKSLRTNATVKYEALIRWTTPNGKTIPPSDFIPVAERSALIVPIGTWVLNEACRQAKEWQQLGMEKFKICVNVSPLQFAQPNFFTTVTHALETHNLPAEYLELELTEGVVMHGLEHTTMTLNKLQRLGVSIAIDDFGTGYSSLAYLRDLPIDTIKIDRSFVSDLGAPLNEPQFALALVEAMLKLAAYLDLEVVAEGIETEAQCALLKSMGCHIGQGYYFAQPLTAHNVELLMTRNPAALASRECMLAN